MKKENTVNEPTKAMPYDALLCGVVLEVLKYWHYKERGFWYGIMCLQEEIDHRTNNYYSHEAIKKALRELKKDGKVITEPIFNERDGKLNGSGWFYNAT